MGCKTKNTIQTPLAKAKGLGSAHHGSEHYFMHGVTTIANIPLVLWVMYSIFSLKNSSYDDVVSWMAHPVSIVMVVLFVLVVFKHFVLELQVVFEDYIPCKVMRMAVVLGMKLTFLLFGITGIVSILKMAFTTGM